MKKEHAIQRDYKPLLKNIREIAKDRSIPIKELANRIGMSEAGVSKAIRENNITLKNLIKLCIALRCPIDYFILPIKKADEYLNNSEDKNKIKELEKENLELQKIIVEQVKKSQTN